MIMKLIILLSFMFIINIPFGYWRKTLRKFSLNWFLSIHIPVIIEIILRSLAKLDWQLNTFLLLVTTFIAGQLLGGKLFSWRKKHNKTPLTSNLVFDLAKEIATSLSIKK